MTYSSIRKIALLLMMCASAAGTSFAQNNAQAMRFLTINSLMEYGQKLYDRGDYDQASAVFNHVLEYDNHQAQALQYLKNMGRLPASVPIPNKIAMEKSVVPTLNMVDVLDTQSLKEAIEAQKQIVEKLKIQITRMRAKLSRYKTDGTPLEGGASLAATE